MEDRKTRIKRLRIRSWRRGMKEMDLILGGFADQHLGALSDSDLDAHEELMGESDQDLYAWLTEQSPAPERFHAALDRVRQTI